MCRDPAIVPDVCCRIADYMDTRQRDLLDILTKIASYRSALEEIECCTRTLRAAGQEISGSRPVSVDLTAVYHPSNVVLYSYVLYGIVPSLFSRRIVIRPSTHSSDVVLKVHDLFGDRFDLPVDVLPIGQREFSLRMADADVVVFTGAYENGIEVQKRHSNALFLYFGSGINPLIVGPNADLARSVSSAVRARTFNSGQDCMCPNVYFIHKSLSDQ